MILSQSAFYSKHVEWHVGYLVHRVRLLKSALMYCPSRQLLFRCIVASCSSNFADHMEEGDEADEGKTHYDDEVGLDLDAWGVLSVEINHALLDAAPARAGASTGCSTSDGTGAACGEGGSASSGHVGRCLTGASFHHTRARCLS